MDSHYAECRYGECRIFNVMMIVGITIKNVILSITTLSTLLLGAYVVLFADCQLCCVSLIFLIC